MSVSTQTSSVTYKMEAIIFIWSWRWPSET